MVGAGPLRVALCGAHRPAWDRLNDLIDELRDEADVLSAELAAVQDRRDRFLDHAWCRGREAGLREGYERGYADGVAARPARRMQTYVVAQGEGFVKIGRSTSLESRLRDLQGGGCARPSGLEPGPVALLFAVDGDLEAEWHARWARCRLRPGEWFAPDAEMRRWMAREQKRAHRGVTGVAPGAYLRHTR